MRDTMANKLMYKFTKLRVLCTHVSYMPSCFVFYLLTWLSVFVFTCLGLYVLHPRSLCVTCLRVYKPSYLCASFLLAFVPMCLYVLRAYCVFVFYKSACLHVFVFYVPKWLRAFVFYVSIYLRAFVFYTLQVPVCLIFYLSRLKRFNFGMTVA